MADLLNTDRLEKYSGILWGLVLLTLPLTTFRYIPSFYGSASVKPLALYPLTLLFPILLLIAWRSKKIDLPKVTLPLLAFLLVALIATLIGFLYLPLELRGQTYQSRVVRAWVSIAVGLAFFLSALWMNSTIVDLKRSLKWMYAGLAASILWGGVQIVAFHTAILDEKLVENIQLLFSQRGLTRNDRISGFAFEPSWLADQVVIFYYPWLLAALLTGYRISRHRWLEPILLLFSTVLLIFTFSRGGVLIAVITIFLTVLLTGRERVSRMWIWLLSPFKRSSATHGASKSLAAFFRMVIMVVIITAFVGSGYLFSQNRYFSSFLAYDSTGDLYKYMLNVSAGPRLAYAASGLGIYSEYPWTGVGLGASSLYLYDYLPDWSLTNLPEINRRLSPDSNVVPNTKNMYVRLLSETGLIGFWFFAAFYLSMLGQVRRLFTSADPNLRFAAIAGLYIWMAVFLRNYTQDSLTFPIMWIGIGMVVGLASSKRLRQQLHP